MLYVPEPPPVNARWFRAAICNIHTNVDGSSSSLTACGPGTTTGGGATTGGLISAGSGAPVSAISTSATALTTRVHRRRRSPVRAQRPMSVSRIARHHEASSGEPAEEQLEVLRVAKTRHVRSSSASSELHDEVDPRASARHWASSRGSSRERQRSGFSSWARHSA